MKTEKKFKILKTFFLALALFLLICPQIVFAQDNFGDLFRQQEERQQSEPVKFGLDVTADRAGVAGGETELPIILGRLINYLFAIVAVIFLTITLAGGYIWMTAGGNEENVKKAKSFIINGINGMIVIFLAYALVYVILFSLKNAIGAQ